MSARVRSITVPPPPSVRVFTLGRFRVEIDGATLAFDRKAQRRPLDLLCALISLGGDSVSTEQLTEALWPDSDGDAAYDALRSTASRLRKLIGASTVCCQQGRWSLDPRLCWVDALIFPACLEQSRLGLAAGGEKAGAALEQALALFQGPFLPGIIELPPVLAARRRLHSLFLRHMTALATYYEQSGQRDRAIELYQTWLEIDGTDEEIALKLLQCCLSAGRIETGMAAYRSLEGALCDDGDGEPSPAAKRAYETLLASAERGAPSPPPGAPPLPAPVFGADPAALSIAVLPFEDLSPRGGHQHLAEAIRETAISLLSTFPQLSVIAAFKADAGWGRAPNAGLLLREPAVRYLLQGSVTVVGSRLRAAVHLTDAHTGQRAWSEQLDHTLADAIKAQDQVAMQVANALAQKLLFGEGPRLLLSPSIQAWKAATLAFALYDRQYRQDLLRAKALLTRVQEQEREMPFVSSTIAGMHVFDYWKRWSTDPARSFRLGHQLLRAIVARHPESGAGLGVLAWACALAGNLDEAVRLGHRAEELMPGNGQAHALFGDAFTYAGQYSEALEKFTDAFRVRPVPPHWLYKDRAVAQFSLGRYQEAASGLATALVDGYALHKDSDLLNARMIYVASLAAAGSAEQARHEARAILAEHPAVSAGRWCRWHFQPFQDQGPAEKIERMLIAAGLPA